jgi:hypothetical protein
MAERKVSPEIGIPERTLLSFGVHAFTPISSAISNARSESCRVARKKR